MRRKGTARTAYAGINRPSLAEVLADLDGDAVMVPLPCAQDAARSDAFAAWGGPLVSEPLGSDRLVAGVLRQRLLGAGARPGQPVAPAAAGSAYASSQGDTVRAAQLLEETWRGPVRAAHLAGCGPRMCEVVAEFRARGVAPPAVAPYLVAPGQFHTRARNDARSLGLELVADVLGDHPHVAEALARRDRATAAHRFALSLPYTAAALSRGVSGAAAARWRPRRRPRRGRSGRARRWWSRRRVTGAPAAADSAASASARRAPIRGRLPITWTATLPISKPAARTRRAVSASSVDARWRRPTPARRCRSCCPGRRGRRPRAGRRRPRARRRRRRSGRRGPRLVGEVQPGHDASGTPVRRARGRRCRCRCGRGSGHARDHAVRRPGTHPARARCANMRT